MKNEFRNPVKTQSAALSDQYERLLLRLKKFWLISFAAGFFIFSLLSYLSSQGVFQTHWFNSLLFSVSIGCWIMLLTQFLSWLIFLLTCKKNKIKANKFLINNSLKKTRLALVKFSISTGFSLFCLYLFLPEQPNADGTFPSIDIGDTVGVFAFSGFMAFCTFMLIGILLSQFCSITLFKNKSLHNSLSSIEDFQENNFSHRAHQNSDFYSAEQAWKDWGHDPMNPASAEYQSTYRHWDHDH